MNVHKLFLGFWVIVFGLAWTLAVHPAGAQTLTWDASGTGGITDGSGTWDTVSPYWWSGTGDVAWPNTTADTAVFGAGNGIAGTVTVGSVTAGALTFNAPGSGTYSLINGTITMGGTTPTITMNATSGAIGSVIAGSAGLTVAGTGTLSLTGLCSYTGTTTVSGGTLQLNTNNGGTGQLSASPQININAGGFLALNAVDVLGYTSGRNALVINDGVVSNITGTSRVTIQNQITMTGGTLSATGAGDTNGDYSWDGPPGGGFTATSDATGNPAVVNAPKISLQSHSLTVNVTRGPANPAADMIISSNIAPYNGSAFGLIETGNGILSLTGISTFTGATTVSGGTLQLNTSNGGNGQLSASPSITINAGGFLALNASDILGYTGGRDVLTISDGTVSNITPGSRVTLQNAVTMTGGVLTGTGTGDTSGGLALGQYSINNGTGIVATSDASGNPAIISANLGPQSGTMLFTVTRGSANPPSDLTMSGAITAWTGNNNGITKAGNGIMLLTGTSSTYRGATTVSAGTLQLGSGAAGQDGTITTTSGASVANGAMLAYNLYGNQSVGYAISGGGRLTKLGQGQLTLTHNNGYTGLTTVGAGTLALGAAGTVGSGGVTIASGAVWDVSAYGSGGYNFTSGVLTAGRTSSFATDINGNLNVNSAALAWPASNSTMTLGGSLALSGGSLDYNPGDLVALPNGALSLTNTEYISPLTAMVAGNYTLFSYPLGGLAVGSTANLAMAGPNGSSPRQTYTFNASSGTAVVLNVTGQAGNLFWNGAGNGVWFTGAGSQNWYNTAKIGGAGQDVFYASDVVTFSDSGGNTPSSGAVTISGTVAPASLTVTNTNVAYTFSGTGAIVGGTSLVKNGPGSLTINNSNAYSGGTNLNGGVLNDGAANSLGSGPLVISGGTFNASNPQSLASATLNSGLLAFAGSNALSGATLTIAGGSLDNSSGSALTLSGNVPQNWNGDFAFNGTQSLNMGTGAVSLGSNRVVTVNANTLTVGGAISGGGDSLTKAGAGNLTLGAANSYSGNTIVNGGTLQLNTGNGGAGALASPTITVNAGGFLALNANDVIGYTTGRNALVINDGVVSTISSGVRVTIQNTVTMTGGTLSATGAGNNGANYSFNGGNGFVATSDAGGNPAVVNAAAIGLQNINLTINVTRGPANPAVDMIIASSITPFGSLNGIIVPGNGILQLTAANTFVGATTVSGGTLQLGSGAPGQDGSVANTSGVINNAALVYNLYGNQLAAYGISGNGSLTKLGQGQLTLTGNNTDSGAITVGGGSLYVNVASSGTAVSVAGGATFGGAGSLASAAANVANGGILDFSQNNTGSTFSLSSLTYAGSSTLKLGALANYTASAVLNAGALTTSGAVNINANLGAVSVLAGTYDLVNYSSIAGTGTSAFNLASVAGLSNRQSASLLEAPGQVELVVAGQTPVWSGSQPDWLSTNAFTLQPSGVPTTFQTGDVDVFDDTAGTGTYGGTVLVNSGNVAPSSVTFNNNLLAYTVSGSYGITGSGALVVQGGGSVTIVNSNGYTGGTTVNNGTLQLGNGGATGSLPPSGAITLGGNGVLAFSRSNSAVQGVDFGGPISGAGSLVQNGPGAVVLTTSNGYTGTTTINGGTLQLGTGGSGQDGSIPNTSGVNNNGTLAYDLYGSQTVAYLISGGGSLEKAGPGLLTLVTPNTFTGGTTVNGGTLQLNTGNGGAGALASPTITVNAGGFLALNAGDVLGYTNNRGALVINGGVVSNITADSRVTIQNQVTMTGGTLTGTGTGDFNNSGVAYGQYSINNNNVGILATSDSNGNPSIISASLGPQGGTMLFTVNRGSASPPYDLIMSGAITSFGGGGNGMAMAGTGIMLLTGSNTYNGATTVSGGTLQLGSGAAGQDGSIANTSGVTNNAALVYNLYGNQSVAYAISGNGNLTKLGQGQLTLTGNNTDSGAITVGGGSLSVNFAGSPATSVSVAGGATFGGAGSLAAATATIADGGNIVGGYNGVGTLTLGSLTYGGSGTFTIGNYSNYPAFGGAAPLNVTGFNGLNPGAGPVVINLGGAPAVSGGTYHLIEYSGAIGGGGFAAFTLGTTANNPRGQIGGISLVNDAGYVDLSVSITPVIWTGSLSTAWNATDTLPAPMNWSYAGSGTDFQPGDLVQFDNSTASGGTVAINKGSVLPGSVSFNNDLGHAYTLTGSNGITGSGQLVKNGVGGLTIGTSNSYSGGTDLIAGTLNANAASALGTGGLTVNGGTLNANFAQSVASATLNAGLLVLNNNSAIGPGTLTINGGSLDSTTGGITLANNAQNWNGDFAFNGTQSLNMGTGAVSLGSDRTVTVNANTLTVNGVISDGGNGYSLTKAGPGNLMLGAASSYTGNTIVNGGTLQLNTGNGGAGALASPTVTVNAGGFLALNAGDVLGYTNNQEALVINDGVVSNITAASRVTIQNTVTMTGGTLTGAGVGDGGGVYSFNVGNTGIGFVATSDASGNPAVVNAASFSLQSGDANGLVAINLTRGPANPPADMIIASNITPIFGSGNGINVTGNGVLVLTATTSGGIPISGSNYTGDVTISGGTVVVAAKAGGNNTVLGNGDNTRTVTVGAGAVLEFIAPNATATAFNSTNVPTLDINGGTVTNAEPGAPFPAGLVNNALNNVSLTNGVLTATTGQHGGYAAWNISGTITSSGNSLISTSDPVYGTVMLNSSGGTSSVGVTTIDVLDTQLTISAPLVQDKVDGLTSGLLLTGGGTLELSGTNTYTGGTNVVGGTLVLDTSMALADGSSLTVGQGASSLFAPAAPAPASAMYSWSAAGGMSAVPEPGTLVLLIAGLVAGVGRALCTHGRRRGRS
jgi:fibronectin-binding autotransporter adhesin